MKKEKAVITFLGTAGTEYDRETQGYVIKQPARYDVDEDIASIKSGEYYNTFDMFVQNVDDNTIVALYTKESRQAQEVVLKEIDECYHFDEKYLIQNPNHEKEIFKLINSAISRYDEVIFDVSHGFRSLPILATINLIIENIEKPGKIRHIVFTQELEYGKEYKIIDLKHYLDVANISFALTTFLNTLKVPFLESDFTIYRILQEFSVHLTSNQFKNLFDEDIPNLLKEIENKGDELFFIANILEQLKTLVFEIKSVQTKEPYEQFLFFSKFFVEKRYYLQSSAYLIEGLTMFIGSQLNQAGLTNLDFNQYENQQVVNAGFLRFNNDKNLNFPNSYYMQINYKTIKEFADLREKIAEIRHNLSHINTQKNYEHVEENIKEYIQEFETLIESQILLKMDSSENLKHLTTKYRLEQLQNKMKKSIFPERSNTPKLETLYDKMAENKLEPIADSFALDVQKLKKWLQKNQLEYNQLKQLEKKNIYLLEPCKEKNESQSTRPIEAITETKIMPNGEVREVKKLRKRNVVQTTGEKKVLKRLGDKLSEKFSDR